MYTLRIGLVLLAALATGCDRSARQPPAPAGLDAATAGIDPESRSRLPLLSRSDMPDTTTAQVYDRLLGPAGEAPRGTIAIALYSPATAAALHRMEEYLRDESALGARRFELLSLVTAREMSLRYEWSVHEPGALLAGLAPATIEAVRRNEPTAELPAEDALLIEFGRQLFRNRHVDSETFAAVAEQLGRHQTFDAIMVLSYHTLAGVMHRAFDQRPSTEWSPLDLPELAGVGTPIGTPGSFVELGPRPPLPEDVYEESWYRWPLLRREELDARGQEVFDRLVGEGRSTAPRGPVGMTLNSPELADPVQDLNTLLRVDGVLGRRTAEIVITATGREMNSQYQWIVHGAAAEQAGAGTPVLEAIRDDADLSALDDRDATAIAFTREVFRERAVSPETFTAAVERFGVRGTVEIAELIGDYLFITTVYNALGMRLRAEQEPSLPHRAGAPVGAEWR